MFGRAPREERRIRAAAKACLETAEKVWHYRRDQLKKEEAAGLEKLVAKVQSLLRERAGAAPLRAGVESLEAALRKVGGAVYPKSLLGENVEFLLMVALVILGFRAYFIQNFVIPTNSMWPTYNGMTPEVFKAASEEPGPVREAARILTIGAWPHRLDAPADGEILIPIGGEGNRGITHYARVDGRSYLVLPSKKKEYTFLVGGETVKTQVPEDFDFDWAVYDAFFPGNGPYRASKLVEAISARFRSGDYVDNVVDGQVLHCVRTGRTVHAGDRILSFDELTGDKVFVDRMSYNFIRPRVGSGFVFRTGNIPGIAVAHGDTFYIKRLVGIPGDTLEVKGTTLYRNGEPITGAEAFEANSRRLGKYPGYEASGLLSPGQTVHVEPGNFFAMGDNSINSGDSREWGFVPASEVAGRPLGIYYPLLRWGLAH